MLECLHVARGCRHASYMFRIQTERLNSNAGPKGACCGRPEGAPFKIVGAKVVPGKAKWFSDLP